jgi:hypothetical protein
MAIARNPGDERIGEAGWPWSHRKKFLERLVDQGNAAVTIQEYRTIAGRFCDAIEKRIALRSSRDSELIVSQKEFKPTFSKPNSSGLCRQGVQKRAPLELGTHLNASRRRPPLRATGPSACSER